jgi:hypothetical protein
VAAAHAEKPTGVAPLTVDALHERPAAVREVGDAGVRGAERRVPRVQRRPRALGPSARRTTASRRCGALPDRRDGDACVTPVASDRELRRPQPDPPCAHRIVELILDAVLLAVAQRDLGPQVCDRVAATQLKRIGGGRPRSRRPTTTAPPRTTGAPTCLRLNRGRLCRAPAGEPRAAVARCWSAASRVSPSDQRRRGRGTSGR